MKPRPPPASSLSAGPDPLPPPPFEALGLAPTLDPGGVKRAWFAALARHPPHADVEGFRRVRAAYEELTRPGGLAAAFMSHPPDFDAELARLAARVEPRLAAIKAESAGRAAGTRLQAWLARRPLGALRPS